MRIIRHRLSFVLVTVGVVSGAVLYLVWPETEAPVMSVVAVCLTDPEVADLCLVDLTSGTRELLVNDVAVASTVDIDSSTNRVIFTAGNGEISSLQLPVGSGPVEGLGFEGWSPRFLSASEVAAISHDRTGLVIWDLRSGRRRDLISVSGKVPIGSDELIYGFAIAPSGSAFVELQRESLAGVESSFAIAEPAGTRRLVELGERWVGRPDLDSSGTRLVVTIDGVITIADLDLNILSELSSPNWVSTSPRWSPSDDRVVWLSDGVTQVEGVEGPVVLMWGAVDTASHAVPVIGSAGEPFDNFPVFPAW